MLNTKELGQSRLFLLTLLSLALIFAGGFYYVLKPHTQMTLERFIGAEKTLSADFQQREQRLETKQKSLVAREKELNEFSRQLEIRQAQWQKDREALLLQVRQWDELVSRQADRQNEALERMARIYEKMDFNRAARLINELDDQLAARLLVKLQTYSSAQILSELVRLNAAKAASVSQKMKAEL